MVTGPWTGQREIGFRLGFRFYIPTHRSDRWWAHHAIKTYGEEEMWSHLFVTSVVDLVE